MIFSGASVESRRYSLGEYADAPERPSSTGMARARAIACAENRDMPIPDAKDTVRLDKWLWAARFFKTRSLAAEEIGKGRVSVNGLAAKPARDVRVGDTLVLHHGAFSRTVVVAGVSAVRGPAPVAQGLYRETAESLAAREAALAARRLAPEPAASLEQGRPTKRDRRQLADWNRWSASADPD
jgi:ribosome-associated heat shock protein Hsp15